MVRATARALCEALAPLELDELREHHLTLAMAVAELSQSAGRAWPWGPDDPTVALLRAVAKLALDAPQATSQHAARLQAATAGPAQGGAGGDQVQLPETR